MHMKKLINYSITKKMYVPNSIFAIIIVVFFGCIYIVSLIWGDVAVGECCHNIRHQVIGSNDSVCTIALPLLE